MRCTSRFNDQGCAVKISSLKMTSWITCQLGAREHYAVPRALHQLEELHTLITDVWIPPQSFVQSLPGLAARSLGDRYHPDLATAAVKSFTPSLIPFELAQRLTHNTGWSHILARNQWFQRRALQTLKAIESQLDPNQRPVLFSYSYTALLLFRYAKQRGWHTILGQIDPGIVEEKKVVQLQTPYSQHYRCRWSSAPPHYWQEWQQECQLADRILVNSNWSQQALVEVGIPSQKIAIAPLAYQSPSQANAFTRQYPPTFTQARPLRVLFLGQIILRKGIAELLEAMPMLAHAPIEIWLVGSTELTLAPALRNHLQLKWLGAVPRSQVQHYYQQADVFLFPTHSDGFGLTQLEAQAWKLPIIASAHCGEVVKHQHNGLLLSEISAKAIADALKSCYKQPKRLQQWSNQSADMSFYNLNQLAKTLQTIAHAPV
jgi:glycosyltransferase involved in cell wall biosynthesis